MNDQAIETQTVISYRHVRAVIITTFVNYSLDHTTSKLENTISKLYSNMFKYNFYFLRVCESDY